MIKFRIKCKFKKYLFLAYSCRGLEFIMAEKHVNLQGKPGGRSWMLADDSFIHTQEAHGDGRRTEEQKVRWDYKPSKSDPCNILCSLSLSLLKFHSLPLTEPPTREQAFKYMRPGDTCLIQTIITSYCLSLSVLLNVSQEFFQEGKCQSKCCVLDTDWGWDMKNSIWSLKVILQ